MKAVLCPKYGSPEVLQLSEVEKPTPKKTEVCIKIFAAAVTPTDCIVRGAKISIWHPVGFMMRLGFGFTKPKNPLIGMVLAGEIDSVGRNVKRFKKGDQVYGMTNYKFGTYAQYKCMSEKGCLIKKPAAISYEDAAAVPWSGLIAQDFLMKGKVLPLIKSKQKVLIYGASGAIGTAAVQLAKIYGAEVTGVCDSTNLEIVKSLGADIVIDYQKEDLLSRNEQYDLIIDAVGKNNSPKLDPQGKRMLTRQGKFLSVDNGMPNSKLKYLESLNELIKEGRFKPVIDKSYPLEQIVNAHRYTDDWFKRGNVVITMDHERAS